MSLLSVSQDLTSLAGLLQVILAIGTFALLIAQFGLQGGIFRMQQKITETQLRQSEIQEKTYRLLAIEHTNRIKPKFTATPIVCLPQSIAGVFALFLLELKFTSNLNITKDIKFSVETEEADIWSEIDRSFEKSIIHPGQHFDFHAKFSGRNENVGHYSSRLHFILEFKDDDLKPYIQHIYTSFSINNETEIRNDEPVLMKYV